MYITENQNIGESVLFLLSARDTLASMVAESDHKSSAEMVGFLLDEATDYEIMSLLVEGKLPEERYNEGREFYLFSNLKESVLMNAKVVSEAMGPATFSDFMTKVDTVYPQVSTQAPMLEFFANQNTEVAMASLLHEFDWAGAGSKLGMYTRKSAQASLKKAKAAQDAKITTPGDVGNLKAAGARSVGQQAQATKQAAMDTDVSSLKGAGATSMKQQAGAGEPGMADQAMTALKGGWQKIAAMAKSGSNSAEQMASQYGPKLAKFATSGAGQAVGGAALAALLAYASAKTYKRFFSKAAKACSGQSGGAKSQCMAQYKSKARAAQVSDLSRGSRACASSKNPAACKSAIQSKIASLKG